MGVGQLYFVYHKESNSWKVGISNQTTMSRVKEHEQNGWELVVLWSPVDVLDANVLEQEVIKSWRDRGFQQADVYMPQGGRTETVSGEYVNVVQIKETIDVCSEKLGFQPTVNNFSLSITAETMRDDFLSVVKRVSFGPDGEEVLHKGSGVVFSVKGVDVSSIEVKDLGDEKSIFDGSHYFYDVISGEEILTVPPSSIYTTGVLYPPNTSQNQVAEENTIYAVEPAEQEEISVPQNYDKHQPYSVAASFCIDSDSKNVLKVSVSGGVYVKLGEHRAWLRKPFSREIFVDCSKLEYDMNHHVLESVKLGKDFNNFVLNVGYSAHDAADGKKIVTIYFSNNTTIVKGQTLSEFCLFQTKVFIENVDNVFLPYGNSFYSEEDLSAELLYSKYVDYAVGHGCDTEINERGNIIFLNLFPTVSVYPNTPNVGKDYELGMKETINFVDGFPDFSNTGITVETKKVVEKIINDYEKWIHDEENKIATLEEVFIPSAVTNIEKCKTVLNSIREGYDLICSDETVRHCFQLMSYSMFLQSESQDRLLKLFTGSEHRQYIGGKIVVEPFNPEVSPAVNRKWRPFQLAFILANIKQIVHPESRGGVDDFVDVIWMPTGGGKTEAYLGLAAFTIMWERNKIVRKAKENSVDDDIRPPSRSMNVFMRYTLRLLTAQQVERSASMICALEYLRRNNKYNNEVLMLGKNWSFTLGAFVGSQTTPNTNKNAVNKVLKTYSHANMPDFFILSRCPWCGYDLTDKDKRKSGYRVVVKENVEQVIFTCVDSECEYGGFVDGKLNEIPVYVVDEQVFKNSPNMVIGTVDKVAAMAHSKNIEGWGELFGVKRIGKKVVRTGLPPALFIQDELHLITGELGSLDALYEVALEQLCLYDDLKHKQNFFEGYLPKIVAATATVKSYEKQITQLYGRTNGRLFPPPALNIDDSFFSKKDTSSPARKFVGLMPSGFTKNVDNELKLYTAVAFAGHVIYNKYGVLADPWWTNLVFYQSKKSIAGAATVVKAESYYALKNIYNIFGYSGLNLRNPLKLVELRSNSDTSQQSVMNELKLVNDVTSKNKAIDLCFATSVIEVGLDIPRLGLITVVGQPKSYSQYIQVTGRVGRKVESSPVIFTLFSQYNFRDKSNYETFTSSHNKLYASVESISVTPYTSQSLYRGLAGALATYVPVTYAENPEDAIQDETLLEPWFKRAGENSIYLQNEINRLRIIAEQHGKYSNPVKSWQGILEDTETHSGKKWLAGNSMRSVDPPTGFHIMADGDETYDMVPEDLDDFDETFLGVG